MVTTDNYYNKKVKESKNKKFTHSEAASFEREMHNRPTNTDNYKWVDVKTKNPVNFTY